MIKCIDKETQEEVTVYRLRKGYEVHREKGSREFYKFDEFIKKFRKVRQEHPDNNGNGCSKCTHPCH